MCAAISRSEFLAPVSPAPARWADGAGEIGVVATEGETRLAHLYQSDPCRVLFPRPPKKGPFEGVFVTTSGGLVGGDRLRFSVTAGADSTACITSQAAEKIYRSTGATTEIDIDVTAEAGATLEWMPQETIAFDGARLRRNTRIDAAAGARILAGEMVVFGRIAHGENFTKGLLHDGWRIFRDGTLVWADALHLDDNIAETIAAPMTFGGATACATLLCVADDAARHMEAVRNMLNPIVEQLPAAATCIGPVLVIRLLGPDAAALRRAYSRLWSGVRAELLDLPAALPRVWES
jgi:urease accessory protein